MRDLLFDLRPQGQTTLQGQIRERLIGAILGGQLPANERLPSSRRLAQTLGVSRNTVTLAYQTLVDDGFLAGRERSGYYVDPAAIVRQAKPLPPAQGGRGIDWAARLHQKPSLQANIEKPADWTRYRFPFVYGQVDQALFPIAEWRECSRLAHGRRWLDEWAADHHAADDALLVEQIRTRLLPRRGVMASENEILVTLGAQQSLYLIAALLAGPQTKIMMENPGYPDVRNILSLVSPHITPVPIDGDGLIVDDQLNGADLLYTTPSHQAPTTVTMSGARRVALLERANRDDFLIIEDDYELESNFVSSPSPALKSLDRDGRVIYVGSLSKTLFPGLRLGFLVAAPELIAEARALRRLMVRHPPNIDQRTAALFLQLGHHDALTMRLAKAYQQRWLLIGEALDQHLPQFRRTASLGGSSVWLEGPDGIDTAILARQALAAGVVIETGAIYFAQTPPPSHFCRLGFSSVAAERIEPGIKTLAGVVAAMPA
jgi:GntR family transcriptional regulator / MocR family aminotransferase